MWQLTASPSTPRPSEQSFFSPTSSSRLACTGLAQQLQPALTRRLRYDFSWFGNMRRRCDKCNICPDVQFPEVGRMSPLEDSFGMLVAPLVEQISHPSNLSSLPSTVSDPTAVRPPHLLPSILGSCLWHFIYHNLRLCFTVVVHTVHNASYHASFGPSFNLFIGFQDLLLQGQRLPS
ncbi:hypothetical protein KC19_2G178600 [Ceratodon purpureus]|uniref:Uncharacterized protein n=1 Tax=Ceratodon purpureus TaxID=3225 RepID=A0A8T0IZ18_CERPU|nr:hypothetical protein KC19_2G178600 [Ceratodon purpureus]